MSLMGDIKSYKVSHPQCSMQNVLKTLSKEDLKDLTEALDDSSIPGTFIERALKARGVEIGSSTISRHRRKACSCA